MKISENILEAAKQIVSNDPNDLPKQISDSPAFYVAKLEDSTVRSFGTVEHEGVFYKIGTRK